MKKNKQGFTLIELLVVIAIIGLLSTLSIVALNQARARSRDARRLADVKQIQTALEMYYNDLYSYPASASVTPGSQIASGTTIYMDIVPKPPLPADGSTCGTTVADGYTYAAQTINGITNGSYTLKYCLGAVTGGIKAGQQVATPSGIAQSGNLQ
ncbi:MAG: prepilin-type N-terminal cleavage/methylation domain-containing protein [Patescibacteria group bacterium]